MSRRRSTNVSSVTELSAEASIAADTRGPVSPIHQSSLIRFPSIFIPVSSELQLTASTDTKERPFKCAKCRSTFVRRDLLLRHDRTVHAKDGGIPLHSDVKRRKAPTKSNIAIDTSALEQIEASSDGMVDLETAAMLMTDLHHKATAAMRTAGVGPFDRGGPEMAYSNSGSTLMEQSVTFPSGAISLPQVPWDSFMPRPGTEPRAHSITSSVSGSQDSRGSFASVNNSQPHHPQLAPILDHSDNACNGLVPALQAMIDSLPKTGSETPRQAPPPSAPRIVDDEQRTAILDNIRHVDSEGAMMETVRLPSIPQLNRYLFTYFSLFHHHLPFLHPASFQPTKVAPALLLAVLSIGALYAFDQENAYMLHGGSKILVNQFLQNKENFSSRKCPLWTMQSTLLNMVFASWSGDAKGLEWTCSIKSLLANMVAGNRYELKLRTEARQGAQPSRAAWVEDEGCRRTYYAVYIFFGLLTLSYNHTPAIGFSEFEDLQLPSTEALWNLNVEDDAAWYEHLKSSPSFMEAHEKLFRGESLRYSAFATRVMINALFLEVWYHKRSPEALQDVVTEYKLRLALETWEKSLALCDPEQVAVSSFSPHKGHPLVFNSMAMFRNAACRLEVDLKSIQEALRYHDSYEVAAAMSNARNKVKRSSEMIKVIQQCFDCLEIAVKQGIRLVARTIATNWSIEHPLCGLDLMVILSLWLYRLENDDEPATDEEAAMYHKVRSLFDDESVDRYDSKLSSTVARIWGGMLDEVVVWG